MGRPIKSDVLVMGSRWRESYLVILEARAAGCPVIAPSIGGIPEIITDGVMVFIQAKQCDILC